MAAAVPLLRVSGVDFAYEQARILIGIDLDLPRGALLALVGPNGSGKTTLLKLLNGILGPVRGCVEWEGVDERRFSRRELARLIAMVPQELRVVFDFTVHEMVMLGRTPYARMLAGPSRADRKVVDQMLRLTDTESLRNRPFRELSGGEQQRVVIAMALAQEPRVLLLDEPTVHLDINHQAEVLELVRWLNRQHGLTVLATMHDLNLAALYFDQVAVLDRGRIVARGEPAEVLTPGQIRAAFHVDVAVHSHPLRPRTPQFHLIPPAEQQ